MNSHNNANAILLSVASANGSGGVYIYIRVYIVSLHNHSLLSHYFIISFCMREAGCAASFTRLTTNATRHTKPGSQTDKQTDDTKTRGSVTAEEMGGTSRHIQSIYVRLREYCSIVSSSW